MQFTGLLNIQQRTVVRSNSTANSYENNRVPRTASRRDGLSQTCKRIFLFFRFQVRQIACHVAAKFRGSIRATSKASVRRHLFAVLAGRARSLLDFSDRPESYEDVGRSIAWKRRSERGLPPGRYERVIRQVIKHRPLRVGAATYLPERILGWFEIAFRNTKTGRRRVFSLDDLIERGVV